MGIKEIVPLRNVPNTVFLDKVREDMTANYQERIPSATQAGVSLVMENLYTNRPLMNEFMDALVNRIGRVIGRNYTWTNPLGEFKEGLIFGDTVEEYQVGLLKAHSYNSDADYMEKAIFGQEIPESKSIFHKINRENYYKITINDAMLRRAFLEESGLSTFISQMMSAPVTSDNLDEFMLMTQLIPEYEKHGRGFFKIKAPDLITGVPSADDARESLVKLRALAGNLRFISTKYNAAEMPVFANPEDLILIATPEYFARIDVQALAAAFNIDYARFNARNIMIPEERMGIPGAQAILTTKDFFRIYDTLIENRSVMNPVGLYNNYFYHHHQIISTSLFAPAIMLTNGTPSESIVLSTVTTATITIESLMNDDEKIVNTTDYLALMPGAIYGLNINYTTTPENLSIGVAYSVTGATSPYTHVTTDGVLHVARDEKSVNIKITAFSVQKKTDGKPLASASITVGVIDVNQP